jgi:cytochrome c oxidase subunit II
VNHPPRLLFLSALLLFGLASASSLPTPSILDTASPNAQEISKLFWLVTFMVAGIVGGLRERNHDEEPPQTHGNLKLELAWTIIPLIILAILLVPTLAAIYRLDGFAAPEESIEVNIVGKQFWWEMTYVDSGIITANEVVAPVGTPIRLNLASSDVMHSFWIPQVAGKTDLIPGNQRALWFTPEREGVFYGQCAELCGDSHANMRLRLVVLSPENYQTWLAAAQTPAEAPQAELAVAGSQLFVTKGCINCHAVQGVNTYNRAGPDLSHIGSRTSIAAGVLPNTRENMVKWLRFTDTVKPGVLMPNLGLSEEEADSIAAYLETLTLPGLDMQSALDGDAPVNQVNEFGYPVDEAGAPLPETNLAGSEAGPLEMR